MKEKIQETKMETGTSCDCTTYGRHIYKHGLETKNAKEKRSGLKLLTQGLVGQNPDPHAAEKARTKRIEERLLEERSKVVIRRIR